MWVRVPPSPMSGVSDFARESYRIDQQIWDALALRSGERALFLGVANEGAWIARAAELGVDVTVLGSSEAAIARIEKLGGTAMRGSATMIPATDNAYDVAVAMHYLHEVDPGFHTQVVAELARVGKRVAIVEPSPPADPLGKRIAALYARAKREAGQFEAYQPIEYWRKLLSLVKPDVWQNLFTFTRIAPKFAVTETIALILDAMVIEEMPQAYLDELRELAARRDAQLLPLSRIVLVGIGSGEALPQGSGAAFRPNIALGPPPPATPAKPAAVTPGHSAPAGPAPPPPPSFGFAAETPPIGAGTASPELPPAAAPPPRQPAITAAPSGAPFALPGGEDDEAPFGGAAGEAGTGFGWAWEPPEDPPKKPD
jgi:methyltransferase family protein